MKTQLWIREQKANETDKEHGGGRAYIREFFENSDFILFEEIEKDDAYYYGVERDGSLSDAELTRLKSIFKEFWRETGIENQDFAHTEMTIFKEGEFDHSNPY